MAMVSCSDISVCHTLIVGIQWKEMEGEGTLGEAVESCGRIRNVGESYRIHWGFVEGYGSLWNIGVHRIGNT